MFLHHDERQTPKAATIKPVALLPVRLLQDSVYVGAYFLPSRTLCMRLLPSLFL